MNSSEKVEQFVCSAKIPEQTWNKLSDWSISITLEEYQEIHQNKSVPQLSLKKFQSLGGTEKQYFRLLFFDLVNKVCFIVNWSN